MNRILSFSLSLPLLLFLSSCAISSTSTSTDSDYVPLDDGSLNGWTWLQVANEEEDGKDDYAFVQFPYRAGIDLIGTSKSENTEELNLVMFDMWDEDYTDYITVEKPSLETFFDDMEGQIEMHLTWALDDGFKYKWYYDVTDTKISVLGSEPVTINDYEMYKYEGKVTFMAKDPSGTFELYFCSYVAYLQDIDSYVYWMAVDLSDNQMYNEMMMNQAYEMAVSLREQSTNELEEYS